MLDKKVLLKISICFALSVIIVFVWPLLIKTVGAEDVDHTNEVSVIEQKVLSYSSVENDYYKFYANGKFVGVISDVDYVNNKVDEKGNQYISEFTDKEIGLISGAYMTPEKSFNVFENIDDKIVDYIFDKELFGIEANAIEFSTQEGIYDIIYVSDIEEFYAARDEFIMNFISEDTLNKLRLKQTIEGASSIGTVEMDAKIEETINYSSAIVTPNEIMKNKDEIYEYLCYGRNTEREYYTVQEGDTLQGVGYFFQNMTPKQIVSLNKSTLKSTDQILQPGTVLNVTYFTSPITISVTKQRLTQEAITPDSPEYIRDESIDAGTIQVERSEEIGLRNVLYQEKWVNGVLQSGEELSSKIIKDPIQGIVRIGVGATYQLGTGNFTWPTDHAGISCGWGCYVMNGKPHNGTDIVNLYSRYGPIYAADAGTVEAVTYDNMSGNYIIINHNNGYKTYYGHMSNPGYVNVGQAVERGQLIGQIGMTGVATGPHIHFMIYAEDTSGTYNIVNVCTIMDCSEIS